MPHSSRTRHALAALLGVHAAEDGAVAGLASDSRAVRPGEVFFALSGTRADGRAFIAAAAAAGAAAVVAEGPRPADLPSHVDYWQVVDSRRALALSCAWFFGAQPNVLVAVTGTAGKSSVADFLRQIFTALGHHSASLGTLGVISSDGAHYGSLTTPDPISLHRTLAELVARGITHCVLEASSHGLDQRRLDGLHLTAGAFTNLGRDHLDYHPTVDAYFAAKMRLFDTLLSKGAPVVINADGDRAADAAAVAAHSGLRLLSTGMAGETLTLLERAESAAGQLLKIRHEKGISELLLPLSGAFQAENALLAAGLAIACGETVDEVLPLLPRLKGVPGRLEKVGTRDGAPVYVDYAHKPDALRHALSALRPSVSGRLIVVFGCGGDRDAGKRPIMGEIAQKLADVVIVTDDNPRSEPPAAIRAGVLAGAPGAIDVGDRREAIIRAVAMLKDGDALLIAGKGHETGQIIGAETKPFSDHEVARAALAERPLIAAQAISPLPLWYAGEAQIAMGAEAMGAVPAAFTGISIDSRTLTPGEAFFAIKGERDGHDFVSAAFQNGAALAVISRERAPELASSGPVLIVEDVLFGLMRLGQAARLRADARVMAITGSVGKTSTKEMARLAFERQGATHASVASYNNHWGVPLTLARMPARTKFGIFEIGMNHPLEILPLTAQVRPDVAIVTTIAPVHLAQFHDLLGIADAKGEIFEGLPAHGVAILNRDCAEFHRLKAHAAASRAGRIVTFGMGSGADVHVLNVHEDGHESTVEASVFGIPMLYRLGAPGRHLVANSLAVLAAVHVLGGDLTQAGLGLADFRAGDGRGGRSVLHLPSGPMTLIDESYNANPASMRAALTLAETAPVGPEGRRIAVLGDMLELGRKGEKLHADLAPDIEAAGIDLVFAAGPLMKTLYDRLPRTLQGAYAETAKALEPMVIDALRGGDVVMIKGSNGSRMGLIVAALKTRFSDNAR